MSDLSLALARYAVALDAGAITPPARTAALRSLVNFVGVTVAGGSHEAVEATVAGLALLGVEGDAVLLGRRDRSDAASAALVNGIASAVLDFDSTQLKRTNIHPSGPVLPALFALAGRRTLDGRTFMAAYVSGVEVACRIANVVFGSGNRGWHVTGAAGPVGAAAAVARAMGLDAARMVDAFGIAANQSSGLREMYGTMCKALTPGRAAQSGLYAALMAAGGFSGPAAPLEGRKGLGPVFSDVEDLSGLAAGLGSGFEIELNTFKPYPCAVVTHATIDCAIALRPFAQPADIAAIELVVPPIAVDLAGVARPTTGLETKFSLAHCAAVGLVHGATPLAAFSEAAADDPRYAALRERVSIRIEPGYRKEQADMRLRLAGGDEHVHSVGSALGSLANPMDDAALDRKFLALVVPVLGEERAAALLGRLRRIEDEPDIGAVLEMARPA